MIEAVLFDFNGVIADDEEQNRAALGGVLAGEGLSLTAQQYYSDFLGFDDRRCLIEAFRRAGKALPAMQLERLLDEKSRVYQELIDRSLALVPGAADFVPRAAERFRLGLVSGALRQEVELVLGRAGLQRYFDVLVARRIPGAVSPARLAALRTGAVMARAEAAVVTLTGPGAVTAAQGLLTNDVDKPGDGAFVYGALLTPKGMIVVDAWVARLGATMSFAVAAQGRERALAIFTRSVPPRLARLADRTAELAVYRLAGPNALAVAEAAGLPVPTGPGRVLAAPGGTSEVARATEGAPFPLQLPTPNAETEVLSARLGAAGAVPADAATLELARILAGWPRLGAEVDDKTIPQEVRYDELGGVSYTKGCYTGQETVSRLHFRGHTNRYLRGLLFDAEPPAAPADGWSSVTHLDRDVGRVTSLAWVPESGVAGGGRWIGLAVIRREVGPGVMVRAAGRDARVVDLPFAVPFVGPA